MDKTKIKKSNKHHYLWLAVDAWVYETFGKRNVVERWFFLIKHRRRKFYKRFPWNAKYETLWRWLYTPF